jgi:hypothetical protein
LVHAFKEGLVLAVNTRRYFVALVKISCYYLFVKIERYILVGIPIFVLCLGILVIVAWATELSFMLTLGSQVSMRIMTAILFVFAGIQMFFLHQIFFSQQSVKRRSRVAFLGSSICSLAIVLLSWVLIFSPEVALYLGLIPSLPSNDLWRWVPGVPSIMTLISFFAATLVQQWVVYSAKCTPGVLMIVGIALVVTSTGSIVGHVARLPALYYETPWAPGMAPHTAFAFVTIGIYLLLIRRKYFGLSRPPEIDTI